MVKIAMKVDWARWDRLSGKLNQFAFGQHMKVQLKELTAIAIYNLQRLTPRMAWDPLSSVRGTGQHLADEWTYGIEGTNPVYIQIYNAVKDKWPVIKYLEFGTRPHAIPLVPKPPGKWLRFMWLGKEVYAKQVHHPGGKAYRMVEITRADLINRIEYLKRELPGELVKAFEEEK